METRTSRTLTLGLVATMSLIAVEYMAVTVAMPVVAEDLGGLQLYGLAFSGAVAAGILGTILGGRWGDVAGPLRPLWSGIGAFVVGLLVAGSATTMAVLVVGRSVQGFGGALALVSIFLVVGRAYPERQHPRMFSLLATAWVVPSVVGPALVGAVVETAGWRLVFLAVPVLTVPAAVAVAHGMRRRNLDEGQATEPSHLPTKLGLGVLTAVGAVLVQLGSYGHWAATVAGLAVLAVALPALLPRRTLTGGSGLPSIVLLRGLATGSFLAAEAIVPLMLMQERGLSPLVAGLSLTVGAVSWALGSWLQGRESFSRTATLHGGMLAIVAGLLLMGAVSLDATPLGVAYLAWLVAGLGMGLVYPLLNVLVLEVSADGEQGTNSAHLQVGELVFTVVAISLTAWLAVSLGYWAAFAAAVLIVGLGIALGVVRRSLTTAATTSAPIHATRG